MDIKDKSNIANIKDDWLKLVAPKYFDFKNTNLYTSGIFGYTNEILSEAEEDSYNAMSIARREVYPISAVNTDSLYKMATLQRISLPVATPATVSAILLLQEKDIISKGTMNGDIVTYVIDDSLPIMADNIQFMLDYPIVILAKKVSGNWSYTTHYDINYNNSLILQITNIFKIK
jgi:hypothetical protein